MSRAKTVACKRKYESHIHSSAALCANVFNSVSRYREAGWIQKKGKSRDIAADLLGMASRTLGRFLDDDVESQMQLVFGEEGAVGEEAEEAGWESTSRLMKKYPDLILDARRECSFINQRQPPEPCTAKKVLARLQDETLYGRRYADFGARCKRPDGSLLELMRKAGFAVGSPEQMTVKAETAEARAFQYRYLKAAIENRKGGGLDSVDRDIAVMTRHSFHGGKK
eukprot:SAG11_NODE_11807_length_737_cov_1.202194_1_plen_224_part_01